MYDVVAIAHGYALKADGTVRPLHCTNATPPAHITDIVAISSNGGVGLALRRDGAVLAWGTGGASVVPPGLGPALGIVSGSIHSLALRVDGSVVGWGDNSYGQLDTPADLADYYVHSIGAQGNTSYAYANGPLPHIDAISHTSAGAVAVITVTGRGFKRVESVIIGGSITRWKVIDAHTITLTVPEHAKTGPIVVDTLWGRATSAPVTRL